GMRGPANCCTRAPSTPPQSRPSLLARTAGCWPAAISVATFFFGTQCLAQNWDTLMAPKHRPAKSGGCNSIGSDNVWPRAAAWVVLDNVRGLTFDSAGRLLHFVATNGGLGRWDWHKEATLSGPDLPAFQWAPAPRGRWAAMASADRDVMIVDLDAGTRVLTLPPEESDIWGLAWSPDAARLAVGLSDGGVSIWNMDQVRAELASFGIETPAIANSRKAVIQATW